MAFNPFPPGISTIRFLFAIRALEELISGLKFRRQILLSGATMERARFVTHKGKQIFKMDCKNASLEEMNQVIEECIRQVDNHPEKSVLTLTIAGGSSFGGETISRLKDLARDNTPFVKAGAIVGVTGL